MTEEYNTIVVGGVYCERLDGHPTLQSNMRKGRLGRYLDLASRDNPIDCLADGREIAFSRKKRYPGISLGVSLDDRGMRYALSKLAACCL
jgi:hypothetical protein